MDEAVDQKMSFLDHLGELRKRIVWGVVAIRVGLLIALSFAERLMKFVRRPFEAAIPGAKLVFLTPTEGFWVYMKVALIAGVVLAIPVVLYQVWAFVAPGLHTHEKRFAGPFVFVGSSVGFVLKCTLAFGAIFELPVAITLASRMGLVTPQFLAKNRKYAVLLTFVVAAILTPTPDIFNQSLMAGPMILLYELGIISARIFGRRPKPAPAPVPEVAP